MTVIEIVSDCRMANDAPCLTLKFDNNGVA